MIRSLKQQRQYEDIALLEITLASAKAARYEAEETAMKIIEDPSLKSRPWNLSPQLLTLNPQHSIIRPAL